MCFVTSLGSAAACSLNSSIFCDVKKMKKERSQTLKKEDMRTKGQKESGDFSSLCLL